MIYNLMNSFLQIKQGGSAESCGINFDLKESMKKWGVKKRADTTKVMLCDLSKINNDRVERYKRAGYDTLDPELKSVFYTIADESRKNLTDINTILLKYFDEAPPVKPVNAGKIYRAWVEAKSKFNGTMHNNLLNSCEFGELAAIAAYSMAKMEEITNPAITELLNRQQEALKSSLEVVRSYRQSYDKLNKVLR